MSVLNCDRNGCQNIMCDRFSYEYGYICNDCFSELVDSGTDIDIEPFMYSQKDIIDKTNLQESLKKYDKEFPIQ